jgi:hypothetical protein
MKLLRTALFLSLGCLLLNHAAPAATIFLGALSYDTFLAAAPDSPGVNAFNVANLTGGFSLPSDFPVADDLTFGSAVLTLTLADASQQVFQLGDIGPGFLLDGNGNPVVQVPDSEDFTLAEFTATLSPTTFTLFDTTSFTSSTASIDVLLTPSSGQTLQADADFTTIDATSADVATPEPSSLLLLAGGLAALSRRKR